MKNTFMGQAQILVLLALASGCVYQDNFTGAPYLVGVSDLQDDSLCARVILLNEGQVGEVMYTTGDSEHRDYHTNVKIVDLKSYYTIYDGYNGHLRDIHSEGFWTHESLSYGDILTIEIPFDQANFPEDLINPFFDLTISGRAEGKAADELKFEYPLGFDNELFFYSDKEIEATEGICGKEYRYRIRPHFDLEQDDNFSDF